MNLELIRKYEKEFLHMLHGGKLKYFTGKEWLTYIGVEMWTASNDLKIIINDEYVEFRKALAEGKTIQFFNTKERLYDSSKPLHTWQDIDKIHTQGIPSDYRIKPKEPKFKVGDWVTVNGPAGTFTECISGIKNDTYTLSKSNICFKSQATKWEPREGEVCIFWEEDREYNRAIIGRLKQILSNGNYVMGYGSGCTVTYSNCMPFTGVLPPHMKDNK